MDIMLWRGLDSRGLYCGGGAHSLGFGAVEQLESIEQASGRRAAGCIGPRSPGDASSRRVDSCPWRCPRGGHR
jgi:hypothetical protein